MRKQAQISCAVNAQLISAFVFATHLVQYFLYFYLKFEASGLLLLLCWLVCVGALLCYKVVSMSPTLKKIGRYIAQKVVSHLGRYIWSYSVYMEKFYQKMR